MLTRTLGRHWLPIAAIAITLLVRPILAAGGNAKAANPKKMTVAQADDLVVQLANEVFNSSVQAKNTHLSKTEFKKAQELLGRDMVAWAQSGRLMQILKSGWKPTNVATPDASAKTSTSTGQVDTAKIEKSLKVSLPEFTDYARYWVDKAMHDPAAQPKTSVPAKHPAVRKQVVKKVVVKQVVPASKPAAVKTVKTTS